MIQTLKQVSLPGGGLALSESSGEERTAAAPRFPRAATLAAGVVLALILSFGAIALVLRLSPAVDGGWVRVLRQARPSYLLFGLILVGLSWFADALRLSFLAAGLGRPLGMRLIVPGIMTGNFLTLSTPFMAGGAPALIYTLNRGGLTLGQSSAVVVLGGVSSQLALAFSNLVAALILAAHLPQASLLSRAYLGVVVAYFAVISGFVWLAQRAEKLRSHLGAALAADPAGGRPKWWARPALLLFRLLEDFRSSVGLLTARRSGALVLSFLCALVYFLLYFSVGLAALAALRIHSNAAVLFAWLVVAATIALFSPTPGGSGTAELGAAFALGGVIPAAVLPAFLIIWRLLTFHFNLAMGGIAAVVLTRRLSRRDGVAS